jgi:hypothetical protein
MAIVSSPVLFLSVYCLLLTALVLCFLKNLDLITVISSQSNRKIGHNLGRMQYLIMLFMWAKYMIQKELFRQSLEINRETMVRVLFGSFTMVGSQIRDGDWMSNLSEFTCQWSHSSCWCQSSWSLLVAILPWSRIGRNSFKVLCTGRIVVCWKM